MALTPVRWITLAIALCGVALVVTLREGTPANRERNQDDYRLRANIAGSHLSNAAERLRTAQLIDSVRSALPVGTDSSRYIIARNVPPVAAGVVHDLMRDISRGRPRTPRVPTDVVFIVDTGSAVPGTTRLWYNGAVRTDYAVSRDVGGRCLVVVRLSLRYTNQRWLYNALLSADARRRLLGPCGFVESFGLPSRSIRTWLDSRDWDVALTSLATTANPPWNPPVPWFENTFLGAWSMDFRVRRATSLTGYACAAGSLGDCDVVLLDGNRRVGAREARLWEDSLVSPTWGLDMNDRDYLWYWFAPELGPRGSTLLSEIARSLGHDAFQRFWLSERSVETAFREQAGVSLSEWVVGWARRMYASPHRGPGTPPTGMAMGLIFAAVSVGAALARAARRQIS